MKNQLQCSGTEPLTSGWSATMELPEGPYLHTPPPIREADAQA
jgi:hypothetical protein